MSKESTLNYWIRIPAVSVCFLLIAIVTIVIVALGPIYPEYNVIFAYIAEITGIFVGIVLGFYWDRAYEAKILMEENPKIINYFIEELEYNKNKITNLYKLVALRGVSAVPHKLKTEIYDIYKTRLSKFAHPLAIKLNDIYHDINILNLVIEKYPTHELAITYGIHFYIKGDFGTKIESEIDEWVKSAKQVWSFKFNLIGVQA